MDENFDDEVGFMEPPPRSPPPFDLEFTEEFDEACISSVAEAEMYVTSRTCIAWVEMHRFYDNM